MELNAHFIIARELPSHKVGDNHVSYGIDFQVLGKTISDEIGLSANEEIEIIEKKFEFDRMSSNFYVILTCRRTRVVDPA